MSEMPEKATYTGTAVVNGAAEGKVLSATTELGFRGGVDPETGAVIDRHHPLCGRRITDRILVIPGGRGSCSGSGVLLELLLAKARLRPHELPAVSGLTPAPE